MAVKMLTGMAGDDFSVGPGEIFHGDTDHESRLIAAGLAEAVEADKPAPKAKKAPK
jgi:hypothetical protein